MTNKLVRVVSQQYTAGSPAVPPTAPYCYTKVVERVPLVGSGDYLSGSTSGGLIAVEDTGLYSGFLTPVYGPSDSGYNGEIIGYLPMRNSPDPVTQPQYTEVTETICVPGTPGSPGTPAVVTVLNAGPDWKAAARSIKEVSGNVAAQFDVTAEGGILIGFGTKDNGARTADVRMGIYVRNAGTAGAIASIIKNGAEVGSTLSLAKQARVMLLRVDGRFIVRSKDPAGNPVEYRGDSPTSDAVFLDALLYTASDTIDNPSIAAFSTDSVQGSVGFTAGFSTAVHVAGALGIRGAVGTLVDGAAAAQVGGSVGFSGATGSTVGAEVALAGTLGLGGGVQSDDLVSAQLVLPQLALTASDYKQAMGAVTLPTLVVDGDAWAFAPSVAGADIVLPPLLTSGVMTSGGLISSALELPAMTMIAADRVYGQGAVTLRPLVVYGDSGFGPADYYGHNEPIRLQDAYSVDPALFASYIDGLGMTVDMSLALMLEGSMFEGLILDQLLSVQDIVYALVEAGLTLSSATQMPHPDLAQYAFSVVNGGATRYDAFEFTDFAYTDHGTYAVKADGLYRLREGDDAGAARSALVDFGDMAFGTSKKKHIHTMYLGTATDGTVYAKLSADGSTYRTYRVVGQRQTKRVHTGKGITAREWRLKLEWVDATAIELEAVEFVVAGSSRRWVR